MVQQVVLWRNVVEHGSDLFFFRSNLHGVKGLKVKEGSLVKENPSPVCCRGGLSAQLEAFETGHGQFFIAFGNVLANRFL